MSIRKQDHSSIISLLEEGKTQAEIAKIYSVTRQRVSQALIAIGISAAGILELRRSEIRNSAELRRDEKFLSSHGCTWKQFTDVCAHHRDGPRSPFSAFRAQQNHASRRAVEWDLDFWSWWTIWQQSGKWKLRGRGAGSFCMCRIGDEGAYRKGNVYIGSVVHNSTLGRTLSHERKLSPSKFLMLMRAAGGRAAVSEHLSIDASYLSQVATDGYMPESWVIDGRAEKIALMTAGIYSVEDAKKIVRPQKNKKEPRAPYPGKWSMVSAREVAL